VLVAVKAAIMNLLSIGAAYGVIVAIFQWGWLSDVVGIGRPGPIEFWVPMMLFTVLFGLSMDYEVFLLSRVREEYLVSGDNATAVADGLAATARVITAAAAIMIAVFMSFVLGDLRVLKLLGLGLATAIFIDATIVRMVLVPATMELLGKANWWLPKWLDRILPRISIEAPPDLASLAPAAPDTQPEPPTPIPAGGPTQRN
jgi:RND superfamily putative drug exporter